MEGVSVNVNNCTCCRNGCKVIDELEFIKEKASDEKKALREKVAELQDQISQLRAQNSRLQKALTSKVFASGKHGFFIKIRNCLLLHIHLVV